jgi:hypothetical protein
MGIKVPNSGCVVIYGHLQPQLKKYRCLCYMSNANHNNLYFVAIPGTQLLNPAICLWKARNSIERRGFS